MHNCPKQQGFSFFELMIAVAAVGILSAVAIPAYRGYIDTANMTKVTASFVVDAVVMRIAARQIIAGIEERDVAPS